MKKIVSIIALMMVMVCGCMSAFATNDIGTAIRAVKDRNGNLKVSEIDEDGKLTAYLIPCYEETKEEVEEEICPDCGSIHHDGCCHKEVERFFNYTDSGEYIKFVDMKDKAIYFVTPKNELILMNLVTNEQLHIRNDVKGLIRIGMNGKYIAYMTMNNETFSVPYEIGSDGVLNAQYTMDFGE